MEGDLKCCRGGVEKNAKVLTVKEPKIIGQTIAKSYTYSFRVR